MEYAGHPTRASPLALIHFNQGEGPLLLRFIRLVNQAPFIRSARRKAMDHIVHSASQPGSI